MGAKSIYVTECGAWTPNDADMSPFDVNLRGNLAFATHIVQYVLHPYTPRHRNFTMISERGPDGKVLEKARCYRRLVHAYGLEGKPLPWREVDQSLNNRLMMVQAVDAGRWWKISLINFERKAVPAQIEVRLPVADGGETLSAKRFGDGETVAAGTRDVTLQASPWVKLNESLAPGETVEYLIERR